MEDHPVRGRSRSSNCKTPSRPQSVVGTYITTQSVPHVTEHNKHRKSRKRVKSISSERSIVDRRKRMRNSRRMRSLSTVSTTCSSRANRSRERRERHSRHRSRSLSRQRMHLHRRSHKRRRSHDRIRSHKQSRRARSSSSRERRRSHKQSCSRSSSSRERRHRHKRSRARSSSSHERNRSGAGRSQRRHSEKHKHVRCHAGTGNLSNSTQTFFTELVKTLNSNRPEGNKFPMLGNVIPEFDPMVKGQTIHVWLSKVEECAKLYNWGDAQIIHYALPKLSGVAKSWYQALPSMSFSWQEWKLKLVESFPSSDDYAELLTEMLSKRVRFNEPLELYYYDKINLLNRCEIYGKRAVDCLLYGIEDRSLRLGAKAAKCQEPEQVLQYFQSTKRQSHDVDRTNKINQDKRTSNSNTAITSSSVASKPSNNVRISRSNNDSPGKCYNCNEVGHYSFKCPKKILKCNICNKLGHTTINCSKLPTDTKNNTNPVLEKSIMQIQTENANDKYEVQL